MILNAGKDIGQNIIMPTSLWTGSLAEDRAKENQEEKPAQSPLGHFTLSQFLLIAHFRVALSLSIKVKPGAQPFIWKWV